MAVIVLGMALPGSVLLRSKQLAAIWPVTGLACAGWSWGAAILGMYHQRSEAMAFVLLYCLGLGGSASAFRIAVKELIAGGECRPGKAKE